MEEGLAALGLRPTATADEVKAAYRRLAKKHHPDLNAGDPAAEEAFKRLTSAYTSAILGTARRDQRQQQQQQQQQKHQEQQLQQQQLQQQQHLDTTRRTNFLFFQAPFEPRHAF